MHKSANACSRRELTCGFLALVTLPILPASARSANSCSVLDRIILSARDEVLGADAWGLTVAPQQVVAAKRDLEHLRARFEESDAIVNENRREQTLAYANALGTSGVALIGLTLGAPAAFAGSVVIGSGLLVAKALSAPQTVHGVDVAKNVGLDRITGLIDLADDGVTITSERVLKVTRAGGAIFTVVTLAYQWVEFARRTKEFQASTVERQMLEEAMNEARDALEALEEVKEAQEMRRRCMTTLAEDMETLRTLSCPG